MAANRVQFFVVINITDGHKDSYSTRPTKRHSLYREASEEARRLATENPGKEFIIFAPIGGYYTVIPEPIPLTYPVVY